MKDDLYDAAALVGYCAGLLTAAGLAAPMAAMVAETLVEGDLLGHDTHGMAQLPGYLKEIESGSMANAGAPQTISDKPAAVLWDGRRLPGPWLVHQGIDLLLPRARELGSATLVIRRSHHIACLAVYMLRALEEGMLLLLACSDPKSASVAPFGGTQAVFTPNPLAVGFPLLGGGVMIDISASITTNGMSNRKHAAGEKFADYFAYRERIRAIPSHRALALLRGRNEGVLTLQLTWQPDDVPSTQRSPYEDSIAAHFGIADAGRPADRWLLDTVRLAWRARLVLSLELELMNRVRDSAEAEAIKVFADNLHDLLLAAPAGPRPTLGLDPGLRTGTKVAIVDATGKLVETTTIYPHVPRNEWDKSLAILAALCGRNQVELIAIGNGTASRETDKLAADVIKLVEKTAQAQSGKALAALQKIVVSEAGASVYSASEFASQELPDVDVSLRGAVSIARRLQDPLAELVKIDPKSIGVGQYQHDVNQSDLARQLGSVVEDCVNAVGVDLNTASAPLLARVSGLSGTVAKSVVRWRDAHGRFQSRKQLLEVSGLGPKTFEQAAGFLRIRGGVNPLDMTGVHPETYPVVERILQATKTPIEALMGRSEQLQKLNPAQFADERFGAITVRDILGELEKPGRDPRPDFVVARFNDGVESIADLKEGMVLEGTVSNVAQFGAFVDLGVHQDGLVHVSQMSHKFVEDAREVVKTGQIVKVKVLEVDAPRKRISLTMKLDAAPARRDGPRDNRFEAAGRGSNAPARRGDRGERRDHQPSGAAGHSAMASAFAKLQGLKK